MEEKRRKQNKAKQNKTKITYVRKRTEIYIKKRKRNKSVKEKQKRRRVFPFSSPSPSPYSSPNLLPCGPPYPNKSSVLPTQMYSLLDIEGTICPITFVKDVLYPYFLTNYQELLASTPFPVVQTHDEVSAILSRFPAEKTVSLKELSQHIDYLVSSDIKDPVLKSFQGLVWEKGYYKGDLKAPLYDDAITFLQTKHPIYIYSSGSVYAQKLLFLHVNVGGVLTDLTNHLLGYYDITTSGFKQEKSSYENIIREIGCKPSEVTFYSDNVHEVKAALAAGMAAKVVVRPGNAPISPEDESTLELVTSI